MSESHGKETLFPIILASTVHDIKNSLGTLLNLIQQLARRPLPGVGEDIRQLEFEANRINHSLMQLLVIYKIDSNHFNLAIDEYAASDIIAEAKAQQDRLSQMHDVCVEVDCREDLLCYCDCQNVCNALGTILNNAQRYSKTTILISAIEDDGYVRFSIEDDGDGYPEHLLNADLTNPAELDWISGNTGLGLYFVSAIARLHKNKDKSGYVTIDNLSRIGGARFCLYLP